MAKSRNTRNRTNRNTETRGNIAARREARMNGRGRNSAYSVSREASLTNSRGYAISQQEANRNAWANNSRMAVYTRDGQGRMSINGKNTAGAKTWTMTPKNDDGSPVINSKTGAPRQSGRSQIADRAQRRYDVRAGMNNITPKAMQAMIDSGLVRVVQGGGLEGAGGNVIRQKRNGNYTMGLSNG